MEQNKKWYAVRTVLEHLNEKNWRILDQSCDNILSPTDVGEEEAEANAKLCAAAPEMKSVIDSMQKYLEKEGLWSHYIGSILDNMNNEI
jgi:hypothetical protein